MNADAVRSAQLMDFLPWSTFTRVVERYGGDHRVRMLTCAEQYRAMAFAQLTYRESLREIETVCRRKPPSSTTWAFGTRSTVRHSPPTRHAIGEFTPTSLRGLLLRRDGCISAIDLGSISTIPFTPGFHDHRSVSVGVSLGALPHTRLP